MRGIWSRVARRSWFRISTFIAPILLYSRPLFLLFIHLSIRWQWEPLAIVALKATAIPSWPWIESGHEPFRVATKHQNQRPAVAKSCISQITILNPNNAFTLLSYILRIHQAFVVMIGSWRCMMYQLGKHGRSGTEEMGYLHGTLAQA